MEIRDLFKIKIILVEPNGPLNVGSVARLCANFNADELRIVSPKCDIFSEDSKKMALKAKVFIKKSNIYKTIPDSIVDCDLVVATYGRKSLSTEHCDQSISDLSKWILKQKKINNLAIIFGREDRGLTNDELLLAHKIVRINTSENYPSLNLSHAVSIMLYEVNKTFTKELNNDSKEIDLASSIQIKKSFEEIEDLLLKVGYLLDHTSHTKINKFKKYILRAETSKDELNIVRGIVKQIDWALDNLHNK